MPSFAALRAEYSAQWMRMAIRPARVPVLDAIARRLIARKPRYQKVSAATGVPWFVIAALHERESGADFATHLHNGDPLSARTYHVPAGRPPHGAPPFRWEESAIDALAMRGLARVKEWSIPRIAYECEGYNGWGYRAHGVPSAYLWSFSNVYAGGKYVADGVWSPSAVDAQCGVMPLIQRMAALDPSIDLVSAPQPGPRAGEGRQPGPSAGPARRRGKPALLALLAAAAAFAAHVLIGHWALGVVAAVLALVSGYCAMRFLLHRKRGD